MHNRTAKLLSAAGAGVLASLAFSFTPLSAAQARDCLAAPKGPAAAGSHWYYRTDHANKRNCWYQRKAGAPSTALPAQTASADPADNDAAGAAPAPAAATSSVMQPPRAGRSVSAPLPSAVADARAEMPAPPGTAPMQGSAALPGASPFAPPPPAMTTSPSGSAAGADPQPGDSPIATIDQRWSEAGPEISPAAASQATEKLRAVAQSKTGTGAPPVAAGTSHVDAGSAATLIGALVAALALAALIVGGIVKFGGRQPMIRRDGHGQPDIWGVTESDPADRAIDAGSDPLPPMQPVEPPAWIKAVRRRQSAIESGTEELEQLLVRAQKRSAADLVLEKSDRRLA